MDEISIGLVVGLGNPGRRYASTRHNIGFMVLDALARRIKASAWREERQAVTASATTDAATVTLLKPLTFMNLSGQAVRAAATRLHVPHSSILVVGDDLDLPFGRIRLRPDGSTGGHNGLRSIAAELDTQSFPRLRIGIGRPVEGDPIDWVLAPFTSDERADLPLVIDAATEIVLTSIREGVLFSMNQFNGRGDVRVPKQPSQPHVTRVTRCVSGEAECG
jgi:peptidyl-tRNA hydrolase, PTH1 family